MRVTTNPTSTGPCRPRRQRPSPNWRGRTMADPNAIVKRILVTLVIGDAKKDQDTRVAMTLYNTAKVNNLHIAIGSVTREQSRTSRSDTVRRGVRDPCRPG